MAYKTEYIYSSRVCAKVQTNIIKTRNIPFVLWPYIRWFSNLAFTADLTSALEILKEATSLEICLSDSIVLIMLEYLMMFEIKLQGT